MSRKHGFELPLHPLQVCAWVITALMIVLNYLAVQKSLELRSRIAFLCVYTPVQLLVLVLGALLTAWDPTDRVVYRHRAAMALNVQFPEDQYAMMCTACNTNVSVDAKHCSRCDRCVEKFDHHCKWLNNCIGKCNYRHFWVLIVALAVCMVVQTGFTIEALLNVSQGGVSPFNKRSSLGVLSLHLGLTAIVFLAVGQLIVFHLWLLSHGITTYEFIKRRRERKNSLQNRVRPTLSKPEGLDKITQETQADVTHKIDESVMMTAIQECPAHSR